MSKIHKPLILVMLITLASGCENTKLPSNDPVNENNWAAVEIGQNKALALQFLGQPDYVEQLSILGINTERLTWQSHLPPRRYQLDFILSRVVAKHTDSKPIFAQ